MHECFRRVETSIGKSLAEVAAGGTVGGHHAYGVDGGRDAPQKSVGVPLDERRRAEICAIVGVGCSQATAARYVGCTPGAISAAKKRIASFREEMLHAEAHHELVLVRHIHQAAVGPNGWRAAAWLLMRRYPERYAARAAETVTPQQIEDSLEYFANQVAREVKDASARSRIMISLRKATRKIALDIRKRNGV